MITKFMRTIGFLSVIILMSIPSAKAAGGPTFVCGDSNYSDGVANWAEHDANPACNGCTSSRCSGNGSMSFRVYKCTDPSQLVSAGSGKECNILSPGGSVSNFKPLNLYRYDYYNHFNDPCAYYQIDIFTGATRTDFLHWTGTGFGTPSCGSSTTPPPSGGGGTTTPPTTGGGGTTTPPTTGGGSSHVGPGKDVYVCGDTTPGNEHANWTEHNANPSCQGCVEGSHCSGVRVDIYKCTSPSQLGPRVDAYECRQNRVYSGSGTVNFSSWFNDPNAVIQIDAYGSSNNLTDFVIWKGNNFGGTTPTPPPIPTQPIAPPPTYPICHRVCKDPNNCPFYNPADQQTFPDVPKSSPYFAAIQNLECENVVHGFSDSYYKPTQAVTRAEMAKIIENGYRFPENNRCTPFTDVDQSSPFYGYIMTLKCNGVITGYPDNTFRPNNLVTRGEASKFIVNGARVAMGDRYFINNTTMTQVYVDVPTDHRFFGYINAMYSNGISDPNYSSSEFKPDNYIVRQEMSLYVDQVMNLMYEDGWGAY